MAQNSKICQFAVEIEVSFLAIIAHLQLLSQTSTERISDFVTGRIGMLWVFIYEREDIKLLWSVREVVLYIAEQIVALGTTELLQRD